MFHDQLPVEYLLVKMFSALMFLCRNLEGRNNSALTNLSVLAVTSSGLVLCSGDGVCALGTTRMSMLSVCCKLPFVEPSNQLVSVSSADGT